MKSESEIVKHVADVEVQRIVTAIRRDFQKWRANRGYGPGSRLANSWDEICVQVRGKESILWDEGYVPAILRFIGDYVSRLDEYAKSAIWYQTDNGRGFACDPTDEAEREQILTRSSPDEDVAEYLFDEVLSLAGTWDNARIQAYLQAGMDEADYMGW